MLQCVVLASAALLVLAAIPIGREALDDPLAIAIGIAALALLLARRVDTLWVIVGAAAISLVASLAGIAGA